MILHTPSLSLVLSIPEMSFSASENIYCEYQFAVHSNEHTWHNEERNSYLFADKVK